ncbi:MAG: cell division protein SepF [Candidatus Margulisiibacteriota bacterium]
MSVALNKVKEFFGFQDEEEYNQSPITAAIQRPTSIRHIKELGHSAHGHASAEIKVEEPRIYEDSLNIASDLRENKPVIVNLKYLDSATGKRLIDFVCGTAYAINGHMMKIGENIFLFTPSSVMISDSSERAAQFEGTSAPELDERKQFFKKVGMN